MMRRKRASQDTVSMAGWLFADLLLGIAMLFFVFNTVGEVPASATLTPSVTPSITPTPTPTSTPTPTQTPTFTPTFTPTPTLTQTPRPTSTWTPTPYVGGLNKQSVEIKLTTNMSKLLSGDVDETNRVRAMLREEVERELGRPEFAGREARAGLVLCFGYTTSEALSRGMRLSARVNELLTLELPDVFSTDWTVFKNYLSVADGVDRVGTVRIEIYWNIE